MGINNLNIFLREKCPHVFVDLPLANFSGKKIAIDGNNWAFKLMAVAHKRNVYNTDVAVDELNREDTCSYWFQSIMESICKLLSSGITPIFVFDGQHPEKKTQTKEKRKKTKEDNITLANKLKEELKTMHILMKSPEKIDELRKILARCAYITSNEMEKLRSLLTGLGIPCLQAKGEAEQLCSMLAIDGHVEAVMSADTDNLAYGCPVIIMDSAENGYDQVNNIKIPQVVVVELKNVLAGLDMTYNMFVDLCIMMGCDYNSNIPLIGGTRAFNLINKFGSIDKIPTINPGSTVIDIEKCKTGLPKGKIYDTGILEHQYCRGQFLTRRASSLCDNWDPELKIKNCLNPTGKEVLQSQKIDHYYMRLVELYRKLPIPNGSQYRLPRPPPTLIVVNDQKTVHISINGAHEGLTATAAAAQ